ncbi:MAG: peptidoglycan-binding domain-containing protein [Candidatus Omnitrophica bacterium]|nr:peptidoglycan-binding domain-containing protein [Candidatus Omnitrophota bacterium]
MRRVWGAVAAVTLMLAAAGCATTRSTSGSSVESRLQVLENKVQSLESQIVVSETADESFGIREESSGVTVDTVTKKQIQQALKNAGYYEGTVDGKIGPKTRTAIKQFQKDMGLKADGIAGKKTKEKLLKYLP